MTQRTHILDNEASAEFKRVIKKQSKLEIFPSDSHRRNVAEKGVQTFKGPYKSILAGVDPKFPMHLWCRLLPQAVLTLIFLRPSHVATKISAYAYAHGEFDYNAMPAKCMVSLSTKRPKVTSKAILML